MQKYLINIILMSLTLFVSACSTISSINKIAQTQVHFLGDLHEFSSDSRTNNEEEKIDSLNFKRTSWYHETQLTNDIFIGKLKKNSSFRNWLGSSRDMIERECSHFYIGMYRIHQFKRAAKGRLLSPLNQAGFKEINIIDFKAAMRNHPVFNSLHLETYQVTGFCLPLGNPLVSEIYTTLPAFKRVNIL